MKTGLLPLFAVSVIAATSAACATGSIGRRPYPVPMHATRALAGTEAEVLAREGMVILPPSSEGSETSFHLGYTAVFRAHQPVYFTTDALLHAWHSSYDAILADLEEGALAPAVSVMLKELRASLAQTPPTAEGRADVDTFLTVASRLASGSTNIAPVAGGDASNIDTIVKAVNEAKGPGALSLFGRPMKIDYSMMKPRGHYTRSMELQRYFQTMSWLGRIELRIAEPDEANNRTMKINRRAVAGVALLRSIAAATPSSEKTWRAIDTTIGSFVGPSDSMSFPGVDAATKTLGLSSARDLTTVDDKALLSAFEPVSTQRIGTQLTHSAPGAHAIAFVFLGQRYVFDAHVMSRVTYGALKTKRMMPSSLDVASTVFKSSTATALLAPEIARFGAEYKDALDHMAKERDAAGDALWKTNLYHSWLAALRELSPDAERDALLPAPLKSEAWGRRMLNTQLASWAELRHDNLLYAKQSVTSEAGCEYPDGYVDPYPRFFAIMEAMGRDAKRSLEAFPLQNQWKTRMTRWLDRFSEITQHLGAMAEREHRNVPLESGDIDFLNRMVAVAGRNAVCTTVMEPEGWYSDLYYERDDVLFHRPIIADVHTQPTDEAGNVVGKVLHAATGSPRLLVVTLRHDGGAHTQTYRGFVSSYAETTTKDFERLTDEDWRAKIAVRRPPPPSWLEHLVVQ